MSAAQRQKKDLIDELVSEFRISGNLDNAFDNLAAERLGVNRTDLHCLNIIENSGGLTAGELADEAGLTTGAVTGVIDRLERAGYARRVSDPADRRRVKLEVTPKFYSRANKIWGPMAADWESRLSRRFTAEELELVTEFVRATNQLSRRHLERLRKMG
ncbi:MAG TPA: MarR family transcriptional regulator [Solirubrobacterales bacterium]